MNEIENLKNEIRELEKEIVETRNVTIKADNTLRSLFAELKKVSSQQKDAERRAKVGSIGAYVLFLLVMAIGAYFLVRFSVAGHEEKVQAMSKDLAAARATADAATLELDSRNAAEARLLQLTKLLREGKKKEAVEEYRKVDQSKLSKVELELLDERFMILRRELSKMHYDQGVAHYKMGGYRTAIQDFNLSLDYLQATDYETELRYMRGLCLMQEKKYDEAIEDLKAAMEKGLARNLADPLRMKIADALIDGQRYEDAINYLEGLPVDTLPSWFRQDITMKLNVAKHRLALKKEKEEAQNPMAEPDKKDGKPEQKAEEKKP